MVVKINYIKIYVKLKNNALSKNSQIKKKKKGFPLKLSILDTIWWVHSIYCNVYSPKRVKFL